MIWKIIRLMIWEKNISVRILHPFCAKMPWFHSENLQCCKFVNLVLFQKLRQKLALYLLLLLKKQQREFICFLQTQFNNTSIGIISLVTLHECLQNKANKTSTLFRNTSMSIIVIRSHSFETNMEWFAFHKIM